MTRPFRLQPLEISEQDLHETVAALLDRIIAPPAEWACYPAGAVDLPHHYRAKLVRMGLKRGWPDLLVLHQRLYGIELKRWGKKPSKTVIARTKGGSPRVLIGQEDKFPLLIAAGMADIAVCRSVDEVLAALGRWSIPARIALPVSSTD